MNARRMALSGVSSLCAMVVVLLVACVPALAAEEHPYIPTDSVIGQVGEGQADGVVTDSHGDIYITNHNKDEIQIYSSEAKKITDFKTPSETGNGPTSLAVDSEGAVYVDYFKHGVYKYRPTAFPPTASTTYALEESAGNKGVIVEKEGGAYAIAVDPESQHLYVAEGSHIASYEPNGKLISATIGEGLAPGADYFGLDVYGTNNDIYVTDTKHEKAYILNPQGTKILTEISGVDSPTGPFDANGWQISSLAVDQSDGDVYIFVSQEGSLETTSVVYQFNSAGGYVSKIGNEFGSSLRLRETTVSEIAVDNANDGDVYVTSENKGKADNVYAFGPLTAVAEPVLTVHKYGNGEGTVTSKSMSIDCGMICEAPFTEGEEVELKATPEPGWKFEGWVGCPSPEGPNGEICKVTMTTPLAVAAKFAGKQTLNVSKTEGEGEVTSFEQPGIDCGSTCSAVFEEGKEVVLTATPDKGWKFKKWTDCASTEGPNGEICKVTMNEEIKVTAEFGGKKTLNVATNVLAGEGGEVTSSEQPGIDCGSTCSALFEEGKEVILTASAETGWRFKKWYNCTSTEGLNGEICKVTMTRELTVTAEYEGKRTLDVSKIGDGEVTSSPSGIACGSTCSALFEEGKEVVLTATAESGWKFKGWSGCASTEGPNGEICKVTMTKKITASAEFEPAAVTKYELKILKAGTGAGTVTSEPAAIDCGATCEASFEQDSKVKLTEEPKAGSTFAGWSGGGCTGTASTCEVTMSAAETVTTTFNLSAVTEYTLKVKKAGTGGGTVSSPGISCGGTCEASFPEGIKVTLTATAAAGSTFAGWSGACTGTGICEVTMTEAKSVTATFNLAYELKILKAGTGAGTVTSEPAAIDCGATCEASFEQDSKVKLTEEPKAGSTFAGWSGGGCTGTASTCEVTMSAAETVTTTFEPAAVTKYELKILKAGTGAGTVTSEPAAIDCGATCEASFEQDSKVKLTEEPKAGSTFAGWSGGGCTGTASTCEVTMSAAETVTATFDAPVTAKDTLIVTEAWAGSAKVECEVDVGGHFEACAAEYNEGTKLTLKAIAETGSTFGGWAGGSGSASSCTGTGDCTFTITADSAITATFNRSGSTGVAGFKEEGKLTALDSAAVSGGTAELKLTCSDAGPCHGTLKLTIRIKHGHKMKTVTIGEAPCQIAAGESQTIKIKLSGTARQLLKQHKTLTVNVTGANGLDRTVTLKKRQ